MHATGIRTDPVTTNSIVVSDLRDHDAMIAVPADQVAFSCIMIPTDQVIVGSIRQVNPVKPIGSAAGAIAIRAHIISLNHIAVGDRTFNADTTQAVAPNPIAT